MQKVHIRSLLSHNTQTLWSNLMGDFTLVFDDGSSVDTNEKECVYSSYCWDLIREYPQLPITGNHHIRGVIKDGRMTADTHNDLLSNIVFDIYDNYHTVVPDKVKLLDRLAKRSYEIVNAMYNDLSYKLEAYTTTLDILDFLEINEHQDIVKAENNLQQTQEGIDAFYKVIKSTLNNDKSLDGNQLAKAVRSKLVKVDQTLQCVGPRGFLTDVDSYIYKKPIVTGYFKGVRTLEDSMKESRSAAKALMFSVDPMKKAEYFSRRQQFVCQNVKNLHRTDCGSKHYLLWQVRGEEIIDGTVTHESDLKTIFGKYYLDEETNTLKIIKKSDTHLIGKTIKMRDAVAGCQHPDPYGICEVCFGEASITVPEDTNLGHMACVSMTQIVTQLVLSTKHYDGSSVVEGIRLMPNEKKYLSAQINGNDYYLSNDLKNKKVYIKIDSRDAKGLADVSLIDDVNKLTISRISEIEEMYLVIDNLKGTIDEIPLTVAVNKRLANLTHHLLRHCKKHGWEITQDNKYVIDMSGWDWSLPILSLPLRHFNMMDFATEIAKVLESTVKDMKARDTVVDPAAMLTEFHDLVNKRITVNLSILSIIIYSSMVVSATDGNYSLPKPWTGSGMGVMKLIMENRSLSATMAYERQTATVLSPNSYLMTNRPDHIFDSLICPAEMQQLGLI